MAQSLDPKKAISYAPNGMKNVIKSITEGHDFSTFLAADNWKKTKTARWVIGCSLDDVNSVSTILGVQKKTAGNRKIVDYDTTDGWKIRFRETQKKVGGRAPDAKTTAMQEKGSAYIFEKALEKNSPWPTEKALSDDRRVMEGLREIYPDVDDDWISNYWKQHKVILREFGNGAAHKFDHSGNGSFMDFITDLVRTNFGVSKKDNWNPADIWMIKGNKQKIIKKFEETTFGSKDSQTIQQLNALMRGMYKSRTLVGISLKKISGKEAKWEEYNIEKLSLDEIDEYKYTDINFLIDFSENMNQDTTVFLKQSSGKGYKFQIKANTSTEFSNLKWESTPIGASAARGGKAQVDYVVSLMKDNGETFDKSNSSYPKELSDFVSNIDSYKRMFNTVNGDSNIKTNCNNATDFAKNVENLFLSGKPHVANTKLMQLTFLNQVLNFKSNNKKYTEFWTDMVFLSIKKGDRFGPFGKLY